MNEIVSEVVGVFAKEFPLQYKDALIEKLKAEAQPGEEDDRLLPDAPVPDYELKTGTLIKKGDVVKNWKNRHFVALNKADNFRIDYYEKEGGKLKGSVNCCGYKAEEFDEDETRDHGQFGIKLVPYDDRRRQWMFKCETDEDKAEWLKIFNNACRKADPPTNPDELIATAFEGAYKAVRWNYGFYGWYRITGTEAEMLGGLTTDILNRELLRQVIDDIPAGPTRNATVNVLRKTVDATVIAAVSAAWNSSVQACESLKGTLESTVSSVLTPIFEQEVSLKSSITDTVSGTVNPFLEDVGGRICRPVLRVCCTPITKAYIAAIQGFASFMKKQISDGSFSADQFDSNIRWTHRSVEYWWSGPLEDTNRICWALYSSDLTEVAVFFSGGFTAYSLYSDVLDAIRDLTHRAIHSFDAAAKERNLGGMEGLLNEVLSKMVHDAKLSLKAILASVLGGILQSPVESTVITPCLELTKPLQDMIDQIPVPGLADLFNLSNLVETVLQDILDGGVGAVVDGSFGDVAEQLDNAGSSLGVQSA